MAKKAKKLEYCYFCGDLATTKDHIPPKCLFSEKLDNGENLITVPSCSIHNNDRSDIDYQMLFYLSAINPNNTLQHEKLPNLMAKIIGNNDPKKILSMMNAINRWVDKPIFCDIDIENKKVHIDKNIDENYIRVEEKIHRIYQESILRGLFYEVFRKRHPNKVFIMPYPLIWPFDSILNDEERATKDSFSTFFQSIQFDKFEEYISSENSSYIYDFKNFYHEKLDVKIMHVCLYKWYYFTGFFCDDELFEMLRNHFKESNPIINFNSYNI